MVLRRVVTGGLVAVLLVFGAACGDDPGEDVIGDQEIRDEGD